MMVFALYPVINATSLMVNTRFDPSCEVVDQTRPFELILRCFHQPSTQSRTRNP